MEFFDTSIGKLMVQGAEGRVFRTTFLGKPAIAKERFHKKYRHPTLDLKITSRRLAAEARCMLRCRKAGVETPILYHVDVDRAILFMELVDGVTVKEFMFQTTDNDVIGRLCTTIGTCIAKLHNANIVHGDLTTSNMMIRSNASPHDKISLVFIDFGLSLTSSFVEDKAVDLYVMERAFISTHPNSEMMVNTVNNAYFAHVDKSSEIKTRFLDVRTRGRKRTMVG